MRKPSFAALSLFSSALLASTSAFAENNKLFTPHNTFQSDINISNGKALENQQYTPDISRIRPLGNEFTFPARATDDADSALNGQTRAWGSFGVPYTTSRVSLRKTPVTPAANLAYLSSTYPYSAIGQLTFKANGQNSHCTASLIRKSVLVTAAHCVQDMGMGEETFSNYKYIPARFNGRRPYGVWAIEKIVVPATWSDNTDPGEGAARENDLAVMIVKKKTKFVGQQTGNLTYDADGYSFIKSGLTGDLWVSNISTFGYSGLLDKGKIMHRTDGPSYVSELDDIVVMYQGSDSTGGASGGPWIANFAFQNAKYSGGASAGQEAKRNVVMGVTSWGAGDFQNSSKNNFSSLFGTNSTYPNANYGAFGPGNIGSLLNTLCSAKPAGKTKTYKQLGYCNK